MSLEEMPILNVREAKKAYPTGDPSFQVMQPFPAVFSAEETDPFLMCDRFGPVVSSGSMTDPDKFPIDWHPHRGMDILTYITEGVGRHADSLGNRETFESPGMQWISVGSGIEHAEGGGTPAGQNMSGFQIWVNVPSDKKMGEPRYGTEPTENIPHVQIPSISSGEGATARLLAGNLGDFTGPFRTVQNVQMIDYTLAPNSTISHTVSVAHDNCIVYVFEGDGSVGGAKIPHKHIGVHFDASIVDGPRQFTLSSGDTGMSALIFAGRRLNQPIAWHGPFVMTTHAEIRQTIADYRAGTFLSKRVPWNYKKLSTFPTASK